jgi:hypothetical protein
VDGISVISDSSIPMRIAQNGRVIWNPAGVYKVSCESDTKYYPMDTQSCYKKKKKKKFKPPKGICTSVTKIYSLQESINHV